MFQIVIACLSLLLSSNCYRLITPQIRIQEENVPFSTYNKTTDQEVYLSYYAYGGTYAIDLRRRLKNDSGNLALENEDLENFQMYELLYEQPENGCFTRQRRIDVANQLRLELTDSSDPGVFFTDVATVEESNYIYVVRNDFNIVEIDYDMLGKSTLKDLKENPRFQSFEKLLKIPDEEANLTFLAVPYLIEDFTQKRIYAITDYGAVSFSTSLPLNSPNSKGFVKENFVQRKAIYNVHYNSRHEAIFVAVGHEGIDIYEVRLGYADHIKTIGGALLGFQEGEYRIIDVDSNPEETILYVLEAERGLLFYDISNLNAIKKLSLTIEISNAKSFDHHQNTFFIVARTQNMQDYAVEVFVDFASQFYYLNRYYIDEMTINDVNVFENYAILIGLDGHKIVYHGVYNGFIDQELENHAYFEEADLIKVKECDFKTDFNSKSRYLFGIGKHEIKAFVLNENMPLIYCNSKQPLQDYYFLMLNSTNCNNKESDNDDSHFTQCQIRHRFLYQVDQGEGNVKEYSKLLVGLYILGFVLVWVFVILYLLHKRWGFTLQFLNWRRTKLRQQQAYNDFDGNIGSPKPNEQELSQTQTQTA